MSHKNYSKFSEKKKEENKQEEVIEEQVIEADVDNEPIVDETIEAEVETVQEIVEEPQVVEEVKDTIGVVDGCEQLYVRKEADVNSVSLSIIAKLTELVIDLENSTEDFYKVKTSEGVEGFCMKKFITIR